MTTTKTAAERLEDLKEAARAGQSVTAAELTKAQAAVELEEFAAEAARRADADAAERSKVGEQDRVRGEFVGLGDRLDKVQSAADKARAAMKAYADAVANYDGHERSVRSAARRCGIEVEVPKLPAPRHGGIVEDLIALARDATGTARVKQCQPADGRIDAAHKHSRFARAWFDSEAYSAAQNGALAEFNAEADRKATERVEAAERAKRVRAERIESGEVEEAGSVTLSPQLVGGRRLSYSNARAQAHR